MVQASDGKHQYCDNRTIRRMFLVTGATGALGSATLAALRELGAPVRASGPFGDVPVAAVDPAGIGAVAVLALTADGHAGQAYRLSGPEALLPAEQVAILGAALGRDLHWAGWSTEQTPAGLEATMPKPLRGRVPGFFADGLVDEITIHPTVPHLLGRPARTFTQ
jgi:uncharacterized protein YbjT (DUF2867 family)